MCKLAPVHLKIQALLHDASEAYILDIPKPIKVLLPAYLKAEKKMMEVISLRFGFSWPMSETIKTLDDALLEYEWNGLMVDKDMCMCRSQLSTKNKFIELFNKYTTDTDV